MKKQDEIPKAYQFGLFRSLRNKLLFLMIMLSLLPLTGMAIFAYSISKYRIQERIKNSLKKMAQDTADKVDLVLSEKKDEIHSMATTYPFIYRGFSSRDSYGVNALLNNYCFNHNVYDVLAILDSSGRFVGINTTDRLGAALPSKNLMEVLNQSIESYPEEKRLFLSSLAGRSDNQDWYRSRLVQRLYEYQQQDIGNQYNIALSEPIRDPSTHEIVGVWINILNWAYIQNILDNVELDLAGPDLDLRTGYAFMLARDANTIIGHKYRLNRKAGMADCYGMKLAENYGLEPLHRAIQNEARDFAYEWPKGVGKVAGLAPIDDPSFGWTVGVEVDSSEFFRPIRSMGLWLCGAAALLAALVVFFTYWIAGGITGPLKSLIHSASRIAQGSFNDRVPIRSSDEVGVLAATFNEMARALSVREIQLQEMNRNLEGMVKDRTLELENSHEALKRAYLDLQSAQEQLIQTEKMASLGQLVSGIAHEIKNPLNFIYGNTGFLTDYTQTFQTLLESFENLPSLSAEDRAEIERKKESMHYAFIKGDLKVLIDNFAEGARRINAIVSDLRTFSRMDSDAISDVDLHASLEMSLNLLRNQYKNRVEIHKEYGDVPKIRGYPGKLNQVFMNLLSNAFHAVQGSGDVWIRTRAGGGMAEVEIEDSGVGIPKEHLSRIFEPFFTTKPVGQGTGLGLSISYGIIEQHQGKIHVTSVLQKGSVFTVQLPISREDAA